MSSRKKPKEPNPVRYRDRKGKIIPESKAQKLHKKMVTTEITGIGSKKGKVIKIDQGYVKHSSKVVHQVERSLEEDDITDTFAVDFLDKVGEDYSSFIEDFPELDDIDEIDYLDLSDDSEDVYIAER